MNLNCAQTVTPERKFDDNYHLSKISFSMCSASSCLPSEARILTLVLELVVGTRDAMYALNFDLPDWRYGGLCTVAIAFQV